MELTNDASLELARLREENARLKKLLQKHGIAYEVAPAPILPTQKPTMPQLSLEGKVALFRSLFRGREDVFARRWYSPKTEKSGSGSLQRHGKITVTNESSLSHKSDAKSTSTAPTSTPSSPVTESEMAEICKPWMS